MIEVAKLGLTRGGVAIVDGVDLEIAKGEVFGIVGPNGAGKSSLVALCAGDIRATAGGVRFAGRTIASYDERELATERAVMSQSTSVAFAFTVLEIVLMGRAPFGSRETTEDKRVAVEALAALGGETLAHRAYPTLSGGEQQRVQLARVLAQVTLGRTGRALFLDEPTASLDPAHQHRALRVAREVAGRGLAVVMVLHDLNLAAQYCDRLGLMARGRIEEVGTPSSVLRAPALERVFGAIAHVAPTPWAPERPWVAFDVGPDATD